MCNARKAVTISMCRRRGSVLGLSKYDLDVVQIGPKAKMVFSESLNNTFKIAKSVCVRGVPFCFDAKGHYFGTTYLSLDHGLR